MNFRIFREIYRPLYNINQSNITSSKHNIVTVLLYIINISSLIEFCFKFKYLHIFKLYLVIDILYVIPFHQLFFHYTYNIIYTYL